MNDASKRNDGRARTPRIEAREAAAQRDGAPESPDGAKVAVRNTVRPPQPGTEGQRFTKTSENQGDAEQLRVGKTDGGLSYERVRLSTDPKDPNYRIVVRRNSPWEVGHEELTSRSPAAQVTESRLFFMTTEEVIWLHQALGELLAQHFNEVWMECNGLENRLNALVATCASLERILTFNPSTYGHVLPTLREAIAKALASSADPTPPARRPL